MILNKKQEIIIYKIIFKQLKVNKLKKLYKNNYYMILNIEMN